MKKLVDKTKDNQQLTDVIKRISENEQEIERLKISLSQNIQSEQETRVRLKDLEKILSTNGFEKDRHALLKLYHSYIQTHAGYIIAITIGTLTLLSQSKSFFPNSALVFNSLLSLLLFSVFYFAIRTDFWTKLSNYAIGAEFNSTKKLFINSCNNWLYERKISKADHAYLIENAPYTLRIEEAAKYSYKNTDKKISHNDFWKILVYCSVPALICFVLLNYDLIIDLLKDCLLWYYFHIP